MRVLVTGGAGFIGSHLVEELLQRGHQVRVLDRLSSGSLENLQRVWGNFEWKEGSSLDRNLVRESLKSCDLVCHLAALVGVKALMDGPFQNYWENRMGAQIVFEEAARLGVGVVFTSSSEVYGLGSPDPLREEEARLENLPHRPRFAYGRAKFESEQLLKKLSEQEQIPALALRLFNVIGPRQRATYGMVLPRLIEQGLQGAPMTVFGDGQQKRSFADVRELVSCFVDLLPKQAGFEILNLGSQQTISIHDLAVLVRDLSLSRSKIVFQPGQICYGTEYEDARSRIPSLERLREKKNSVPSRSLKDIVQSMLLSAPRQVMAQ